eukprot:3370680-Rhodomonas_salina.1
MLFPSHFRRPTLHRPGLLRHWQTMTRSIMLPLRSSDADVRYKNYDCITGMIPSIQSPGTSCLLYTSPSPRDRG